MTDATAFAAVVAQQSLFHCWRQALAGSAIRRRQERLHSASAARRIGCAPRGSASLPPQQPSGADDELGAPPSLAGRDWREFRATLFAGGTRELANVRNAARRPGFWAHPLALPECGSILASHPALYRHNQPYLTQAVVFLTQHDPRGSRGLILNRPLAGTVAELERGGLLGRSSSLAETALAGQPVYLGGPNPLGFDTPIAVIHGHCSGIDPESHEPLQGVYMGSSRDVMGLVEKGHLKPEEVRLFYGCVAWEPGALLAEVEDGEWFPASASRSFALEQCIGLQTPLWRELMECMGSVYENIARKAYGDADQAS
jgi:putative AlgH/UPF0301 family transcriptional regulator